MNRVRVVTRVALTTMFLVAPAVAGAATPSSTPPAGWLSNLFNHIAPARLKRALPNVGSHPYNGPERRQTVERRQTDRRRHDSGRVTGGVDRRGSQRRSGQDRRGGGEPRPRIRPPAHHPTPGF
jgi:hypothetical protein